MTYWQTKKKKGEWYLKWSKSKKHCQSWTGLPGALTSASLNTVRSSCHRFYNRTDSIFVLYTILTLTCK